MRSFRDEAGTEWIVWAVRPSRSRIFGVGRPSEAAGAPADGASSERTPDADTSTGSPAAPERRHRTDRRRAPAPDPIIERRRGGDRRANAGHGPGSRTRTAALAEGWLAFQAGSARRRLTPIPADWESCPEADLRRLARLAVPVSASPAPVRSRADEPPR